MSKDIALAENAKDEWLKLVKKHKRKQKGLPALSSLNTNAGNVEHNICMFNAMQGDGNISVDAVNGNVSSSDSGAMGESLVTRNPDMIQIYYPEITIEVLTKEGNPLGKYDSSMGAWYPDDDEYEDKTIEWTYEVDPTSVVEFLQDVDEVRAAYNIDNLSDEEFEEQFVNKISEIAGKYEDLLRDYFEEAATEDAQDYYWDHFSSEDLYESKKQCLDDNFDMSMRTLL